MPEPDVTDFNPKPQNPFKTRILRNNHDTILLRIMQHVEIAGELMHFLEMLGDTSLEQGMDIQLQ